MPVKIDESGRRSVEAEVEVPGTPEHVWDAIASGPGISSWFVPSEIDERVGGAALTHFGPGMDSVATITAWEPPHRFVAETQDELGPDDPPVATEWIVESRSGGTCVVRVVHSWFASSDDWDNQFEGHTYGWLAFFRILRLYLTHFPGQPSTSFQLMGVASGSKADAWDALTRPLGLVAATIGQRVSTPAGAPPCAGTVESVGQGEWPELLIRLDEPARGAAHFVPHEMGDQVFLTLRFYLYGDQAPAAVERAEPVWQAWLNEHFAPVGVESATA